MARFVTGCIELPRTSVSSMYIALQRRQVILWMCFGVSVVTCLHDRICFFDPRHPRQMSFCKCPDLCNYCLVNVSQSSRGASRNIYQSCDKICFYFVEGGWGRRWSSLVEWELSCREESCRRKVDWCSDGRSSLVWTVMHSRRQWGE